MADLIIYTSQGIMIVEVEFNRDFWEAMLKKLTTFYKDYLVPKLLTWKMHKHATVMNSSCACSINFIFFPFGHGIISIC